MPKVRADGVERTDGILARTYCTHVRACARVRRHLAGLGFERAGIRMSVDSLPHDALDLRQVGRQALECGGCFHTGPGNHRGLDSANRSDGIIEGSAKSNDVCNGAVVEHRIDLRPIPKLAVALAWRDLTCRKIDISQGHGTQLSVREQRSTSQCVDDRHPVGQTIERVATQNRVLIETRIEVVPVRFDPLRRDAQNVEECGEPVGANGGRGQMHEHPKIPASCQRFKRLGANLTPIRCGFRRGDLSEQPEGIERRQHGRVLQVLPTWTGFGNRLTELPEAQISTHKLSWPRREPGARRAPLHAVGPGRVDRSFGYSREMSTHSCRQRCGAPSGRCRTLQRTHHVPSRADRSA